MLGCAPISVAQILPSPDTWGAATPPPYEKPRSDGRVDRRSELPRFTGAARRGVCTARDFRILGRSRRDGCLKLWQERSRVVFTTTLWFCFPAQPNGSRLSCGALKKDSFRNLRAPSASSAC